jgi:hypothetical protein
MRQLVGFSGGRQYDAGASAAQRLDELGGAQEGLNSMEIPRREVLSVFALDRASQCFAAVRKQGGKQLSPPLPICLRIVDIGTSRACIRKASCQATTWDSLLSTSVPSISKKNTRTPMR